MTDTTTKPRPKTATATTPATAPDATETPLARAERESIERAAEVVFSKRKPFKVQIADLEGGVMKLAPDGDMDGWQVRRLAAFGTRSQAFAAFNLGRLASVARQPGQDAPTEDALNALLAIVDAVEPADEIEALLAVQIAATHETSMDMLTRAKVATDGAVLERCVNAATKLQRTLTAQVEALAKLRRGGEQTVRVEHVHVHEGGQAIVGNVGAPVGGAGRGRSRKAGAGS